MTIVLYCKSLLDSGILVLRVSGRKVMTLEWHKSTCPYCGFGCGLEVGVDAGKVVKIRGLKGHPANDGDLCMLPRNYVPIFYSKDRLKQPMIKKDNELIPVTWDVAINYTARKLNEIIRKYGPDSIAFYGGAMNLTEEYYLMNKLMKAAIGTNNIECSTRLCMASSAIGFFSTIGVDAPPTCYEDIEKADLFLIAGYNMANSTPVLFRRIQKAKRNNNAKIIVIDPRITKTAEKADYHLQLKPGTDVALNNCLAHVLFEENLVDMEFVKYYTSGVKSLREFVKDYTPSYVSEITGCSEEEIVEVAQVIGKSKNMLTFWFQGYNHSSQAVFKNNTLHNLSLLTNNFCREGAGPLSITGESNALGNRWVGALSHLLPGLRLVTNVQHRKEMAEFWDIPVKKIRDVPGPSILDIINGLHSGDIKAIWIMTTNPAASLPHSQYIIEAFEKAELVIVQDIFHPTETTQLADVVLAAAQWCEKTGTYISSERRIELVEKIIEPPGEAIPDYEIIWLVARAMGFEKLFPYTAPEQIFEEWKEITRGRTCDMTGVTYQRLKDEIGPQLPCSEEQHQGTKRLFTDWKFPRPDGRAALLPRPYKEPLDKIDPDYPYVLITGRLGYHFNTRTRTGRVPKLNERAPEGYIEINKKDAYKLKISEEEEVKIKSRRGSIQLSVKISNNLREGDVFIPWHYGKELGIGEGKSVNILTNPVYDFHSKQPEYKFTAIQIIKKGEIQ